MEASYQLHMDTRQFILMIVDTVQKETGKKVTDVTFDIDLPQGEITPENNASVRGVRFSLVDHYVEPKDEDDGVYLR
jgi:hypothetical protein